MNPTPTLLAVFAHPDDEAFSSGGTLAHYASLGVKVVLACATRGEAGKITDPNLKGIEDLGRQREQELKDACRALGIPDPVFLDFHDSGRAERTRFNDPKALMNVDPLDVEPRIRALIEEHAPQVMLTFDPHGGYGHIDHLVIHRAATAAFFSTGHLPQPPQRLYFTALSSEAAQGLARFNPGNDPLVYGVSEGTVAVRLDVSAYGERKQEALRAHGTQTGPESRMAQADPAEREVFMRRLIGTETFSIGGTRTGILRYPLRGFFDGLEGFEGIDI